MSSITPVNTNPPILNKTKEDKQSEIYTEQKKHLDLIRLQKWKIYHKKYPKKKTYYEWYNSQLENEDKEFERIYRQQNP